MERRLAGEPTGPLRGVRVVDHSSVIFGPMAAQMLGDLGADVIKVEPQDAGGTAPGDPTRSNGPRLPGTDDLTPLFAALNRNKRSITLDLRTEEGRRDMADLLATADVFVTNTRAGGLERLGLTYEAVRAIRPDIVYVHATGFGSGGRYAGRAAYDDVIQAAAGVSYLLTHGREDAPPRFVPSSIADKVSGMFLAQAVLAALYERAVRGTGQFVEVPMFECTVAFNMVEHLHGRACEPPIAPAGYPRVFESWSRPLRTADGHIAMLVYNTAQWRRLLAVAGLDPAILDDPRYAGPAGPDRAALVPMMEEVMMRGTTAEWEARLAEADVAFFRQNSFDDVLADPHLADVSMFEEVEHPDAGTLRMVRHPVRYAATPANTRRLAPRFGEHNGEVLAEVRGPGG